MYSIKEFRESRKGVKPFNKPGSWWSSQHVRWINGRTGGEATETNDIPIEEGLGEAFLPNNGVYSLHFDWVQVTRIGKKPYSVGLIVLRCDDVEESKLNTDPWAMPLMVIPGPDEPRCMDIHWEIIRSQFYDYSEGDQEMNVSYREDGILHEFVHKPFLVRVCCDAMARHKIMCSRPAASLHTCPWCWVESSPSERSKVFGYAKPIQHQVFNWDDFLQMRHSDIKPIRTQDIHIGITPESEYKVTLEEHKRRSEILDTLNRSRVSTSFKVTAKKHLGLSGKSHISWGLKALHPLQFVYLPMYHLLFLGIVKDFLKHIFRPDKALAPVSDVMAPNKSNFKEFASARERIILNSDIAEECISLDNMHGWLIAPLIAFVEVHSCFLFNEEVSGFSLLSKPCKRAWGFLRRAVMYFLRDTDDPFDADTIQILRENARRDLIEYAKICEEHMPSLCVQNLHIGICRLFDQEQFCGRPNICHDLFTERAIRHLKKFPYRRNHEKSFVYRQLYRECRMNLARTHDIENPSEEMSNSIDANASRYDPIGNDKTHFLLGKGVQVLESDKLYSDAMGLLQDIDDEDTLAGLGHDLFVFKHKEMSRHIGNRFETVKSLQSNRETLKNSKLVLINCRGQKRIALVTAFFRVSDASKTRLVGFECHLYKRHDLIQDDDTGTVYRYRHYIGNEGGSVQLYSFSDDDFEEKHVTFRADCIIGKLVQFISPQAILEGEKRFVVVNCVLCKSRSGQKPRGGDWTLLE